MAGDAPQVLKSMACNSLYMLDGVPVGEDEYLTMVEVLAEGDGKVSIHSLREVCWNTGTQPCPHLINSCQASNTSHCIGSGKAVVWDKTAACVSEVLIPYTQQENGSQFQVVNLTSIKPDSFLSLGCDSSSVGEAKIKYRSAVSYKTPGDAKFSMSVVTPPIYEMTEQTNHNLLVRLRTVIGQVAALGLSWTCPKTRNVTRQINETMSDEDNELWTMMFSLLGGFEAGRRTPVQTHVVRCQTRIVVPAFIPESYIAKGDTEVEIPLISGSSVTLSVNLQGSEYTNYLEEVPEGGMIHRVAVNLNQTGKHTFQARAENQLSATDFNITINAVPIINRVEWTVTNPKPWATPPGNITLTLSCVASEDPPWTANLTVNVVNSSDSYLEADQVMVDIDPQDLAPSGFNFTKNLTFSFPDLDAGTYDLTANFSNEVSWVRFRLKLDMKVAVQNISVRTKILLTNTDQFPPMMMGDDNVFPSNITIVFIPTAAKGVPDFWALFDEEDRVVTSTGNADTPLRYIFFKESIRNMTVKAYSVADGWVPADEPLIMRVVDAIYIKEFTDSNMITLPGDEKTFEVSFRDVHPYTCLVVDFGDADDTTLVTMGHKFLCTKEYPKSRYINTTVSNNTTFTYTYQREGLYKVSLVAVYLSLLEKRLLAVVVGESLCMPPEVWIPGNVNVARDAPSYLRSQVFRVRTKGALNCTKVVHTKMSWMITKVNDRGVAEKDLVAKDILPLTWNYSQLVVPPRVLELGTYRLTYQLQICETDIIPVYRTAISYVKVVASPLQVVLVEGGLVEVYLKDGSALTLDPVKYSLDPDNPEDKNMTFEWVCLKEGVNITCPHLDEDERKLHLSTDVRPVPSVVFVKASKDTRYAWASVQVKVTNTNQLNISLVCAEPKFCKPSYFGYHVLKDRVAIEAVCTAECPWNMKFSWFISTANGTFSADRAEILGSPRNLILGKDFFTQYPDLEVFDVILEVSLANKIMGKYSKTLIVDKPPTGGNCTVVPAEGIALFDTFFVNCLGWEDPEMKGIDEYVFTYDSPNGEPMQHIIGVMQTPDVELILPAGTFSISCTIRDRFGSHIQVYIGSVEVRMPNISQMRDFNLDEMMSYLTSVGDQDMFAMVWRAWHSVNERIKLNNPQDQIKEALQRENVAGLTTSLMNTATLSQLVNKASVVHHVVMGDSQAISLTTKKRVVNLIETMTNQLEEMDIKSPDDLTPFVTSTIGAVGSIYDDFTKILRDKNLSNIPAIDIQEAENWDYDVDISLDHGWREYEDRAQEWSSHPGPKSFTNTSELLSEGTRSVSISVLKEGEVVNLDDVKGGIIINIPREPENIDEMKATVVTREEANALMNHQPFMYHTFELPWSGVAVVIEISPSAPRYDLLLLIRHNRLPTLSLYEHLFRVHPPDKQQWFLGSKELHSQTGNFYLAVGALHNVPFSFNFTASNLTKTMFKWDLGTNYSLKISMRGCYYFNEREQIWCSKGVKAISTSQDLMTRCNASHLTTFGTGLSLVPFAIDFAFITPRSGFIDNITIYVAITISLSVFACFLVWARMKDRHDVEKRGVTPLYDNRIEDQYLYEVVVYTGSKKGASYLSKVQMILSGEYAETEVRTLENKERKIFCRNGIDSFVMAVPRPLGELEYLRVWHNNSGDKDFASWHLMMISVRDLQTGHKTTFLANRWLAVDKCDGQVDVTLRASELGVMAEFSHLFDANSQRAAKEGNIWVSMFYGPHRSRFTRFERTIVCITYIYLCMVCSGMWLHQTQIGQDEASHNQQVVIGISSLVIVYPIIHIIAWLFRLSGPRVKPLSRAIDARLRQQEEQREEAGIFPEQLDANKKQEDIQENLPPHRTAFTNNEGAYPVVLPWWCRWVAWVLVLLALVLSLFYLLHYGILFGETKTKNWLISTLISFFVSMLVVEPLMVLIGATLMSSLCKKRWGWQLDTEDIDYDELYPELECDEQWQHIEYLDLYCPRKVHKKLGVQEQAMIDQLRTKLEKEREMKMVIRSLLVYIAFLLLVLIMAQGSRNKNNFLMVSLLRNTFIKEGHNEFNFKTKIKTADDYWRWLKEVALVELKAQRDYNGRPPYSLRGYLSDYQNRILGYAILRQIRTKRNNCRPSSKIQGLVKTCTGKLEEDVADHCAYWLTKPTFQGACTKPEFKYTSAKQLGAYTKFGKINWFSGGGYVTKLSGYSTHISANLDFLQKLKWIDNYTRAILLEFSVYNVNVDLYGIATVFAEFNPGGGVIPSWQFQATTLNSSRAERGAMILVKIFFMLAVVFFTFQEIWACFKCGIRRYFTSYWNFAEVVALLLSYISSIFYYLRWKEIERVEKTFSTSRGNEYIRMDYVLNLDMWYDYALNGIVFISIIKLLKLLQFNARMNLIGYTLSRCWNDLRVFFLTFGIIHCAFTIVFYFLFNFQLDGFRDFLPSMQKTFAMMMGKFDFQEMVDANAYSPILFFIFSLSTNMILINLMITIIIMTFYQVRTAAEFQHNKYDILEYLWTSVSTFLKLKEEEKQNFLPHIEDPHPPAVDSSLSMELTEKVDQFLSHINDFYFNSQMDLHDLNKCKSKVKRKLFKQGQSGKASD